MKISLFQNFTNVTGKKGSSYSLQSVTKGSGSNKCNLALRNQLMVSNSSLSCTYFSLSDKNSLVKLIMNA